MGLWIQITPCLNMSAIGWKPLVKLRLIVSVVLSLSPTQQLAVQEASGSLAISCRAQYFNVLHIYFTKYFL